MNIMLIDTSYLVFFRYHACRSWYSRNGGSLHLPHLDAPAAQDPFLTSADFMSKFDKVFESSILSMAKTRHVSNDCIVFIQDCRREKVWRHQHIADYKGKRRRAPGLPTTTTSGQVEGNIFTHTYETLLPRLIRDNGFALLSHPRLEADDVAAIVTRHVRKLSPDKEVHIITNDNDFLQLIDDPSKVHIVNLQHVALIERLPTDMPPSVYLIMKIVGGDKSDSIPAIARRIGPKTAERLARDPVALSAFLASNEEATRAFDRNRLLMSFDHIPHEHVECVTRCLHVPPYCSGP